MFKKTRIKLTFSYLLIVMVITTSFSFIIYNGVNSATKIALKQHETRIENRLRELRRPLDLPPRFQEEYIKEAVSGVRTKTINLLVGINTFIWVTTLLFGYWFAGRTLKPIEEMANKQKKFIENAAHELKTPLTSIKTQLEVHLRNKKLDAKKTKEVMISTIEDIDTLTSLTNSLIRQTSYQNYNNARQQVNMKEIVESALSKFSGQFEKRKISLKRNLKNVKVEGDKKALNELINILIDNSIKFNKERGNVEVALKKTEKCAEIVVSDTGRGINNKDIPYIFDRFYKAETSRTKQNAEGFGLGLSIAKEIVDAHKGTIKVESTEEKGTSFTVKIPL